MSEPIRLPTPVGGAVTDDDVVPSIVFITVYSILIPIVLWNYFKRHQWTIYLIGSTIFLVERVVVFSLRLRQAKEWSSRTSGGLLVYQQITLGNAYLGIPGDLIGLFRCLLVQPTLPDTEAGLPNQIRTRFWYRRWADVFGLIFLSAVIPGAVAGGRYGSALNNQDDADAVRKGRDASTILGLVLMTIALICIIYFTFRVPRIARRKCYTIIGFFIALMATSIYRITILNKTTTSLLDRSPDSLTSGKDKALFYIFQNVPEFFIVAWILAGPTRDFYGTGRWGDPGNDYFLNKKLKEEEERAAGEKAPTEGNALQHTGSSENRTLTATETLNNKSSPNLTS